MANYLKLDNERYNKHANSMAVLRPNDIGTDAIRHYIISSHFDWNHTFTKADFEDLDLLLRFKERDDFYFWIACQQQKVVTPGVYTYLPVVGGSTYWSTFNNLTNSINIFFGNIITSISIIKQPLIESSTKVWMDFFKRKEEAAVERGFPSKAKRELLIKKASNNIFNAIRRKDIKAIIALRRKGADPNFINEDGLTSIEYAKKFNDDRLIEALTKNLIE